MTGTGGECAASMPALTFVVNRADGSVYLRGQNEREVVKWVPPDHAVCPLCGRTVLIRKDGKGLAAHVWEPKQSDARKPRGYESDANRAARAFEKRGRKPS